MVKSIGVASNVKDDKKQQKNDKKKSLAAQELDANKVLATDEDLKDQKASKTKITEGSEELECRICHLSELEEPDPGLEGGDPNPMISPCKCTGTMGIIHLKCLRLWLEQKRVQKVHKGQIMVKFHKLDCELCTTQFPFKIVYQNRIVDIVGVDKPEKNYIILESLSNEQHKIFHIIDTTTI